MWGFRTAPWKTPAHPRGAQAAAWLLSDLLPHPLGHSLPRATRPRSPLHFRSTVTDKGCRLSISLRLSSSCTPRVGLRRFWGGVKRSCQTHLLPLLSDPQTPLLFTLHFVSSLVAQTSSAVAMEQP